MPVGFLPVIGSKKCNDPVPGRKLSPSGVTMTLVACGDCATPAPAVFMNAAAVRASGLAAYSQPDDWKIDVHVNPATKEVCDGSGSPAVSQTMFV